MDRQNRVGSKFGGGGVMSGTESNVQRRERLRQLALETIDLAKDPYFMRNHLGSYECKLCLTLHTNEGSYLAHTQGKKHQTNLARRAAREAKEATSTQNNLNKLAGSGMPKKKEFIKIGRPGYTVTKIRDPNTRQYGMLVQILYPKIKDDVEPMHRFMSAYEQKVEPPNRNYQYLIVAAEPYESIAFKIPSQEIDMRQHVVVSGRQQDEDVDLGSRFWSHWDPDTKQYSLQFFYKLYQQQQHQQQQHNNSANIAVAANNVNSSGQVAGV